MSQDAFFDQIEQNVISLIAEQRFQEAHSLCTKYITEFPRNQKLKDLKTQVEEAVFAHNESIIEENLNKVEKLMETEDFKEAIQKLIEIKKLNPKHKKVNELLYEAETKYKSKTEEEEQKYIQEHEKRLQEVLENNPTKLIDELFFMDLNNPGNNTVKTLTDKFREKIIHKKIEDHQELVYSEKFDDIYHFISELKKIDSKNQETLELEAITKTRQYGSQIEQHGEFLYRGEKHLETLMKLKKYTEAYKVAEELLKVNSQNKVAKNTFKKAENKIYQITREEVIDQIESKEKANKEDYKKNPEKYITI